MAPGSGAQFCGVLPAKSVGRSGLKPVAKESPVVVQWRRKGRAERRVPRGGRLPRWGVTRKAPHRKPRLLFGGS